MTDHNFDEHIKGQLNGRKEEYDPLSWDALSEKLNDTVSENVANDPIIPAVKEKLENHREAYNEKHWEMLSEELDYIEARKKRLYILKAAEAAILLLLVFTYWNYNQLSGSYDADINRAYVGEISTPDSAPEELMATLETTQDITPLISDYLSIVPSSLFLSRSEYDQVLLSKKKVDEVRSLEESQPIITKLHQSPERVDLSLITLPAIEIGEISFKHAGPVDLPPSFLVDEVVLEQPQKDNRGWWINMPFSYDVNLINSAFDVGYLAAHIDQGIYGQSFGLTLSYQIKNVEIETGFKYSDKTYAPGLLKNYSISSNSKNSILESELDAAYLRQLQIPILLKLHAPSSTKNHLYAVAGIGLNTIFDTDYSIKKSIQPFARVDAQDVTKGLIALKDLPNGLAEGGRFDENFYVTAVLGFGLQTQLRSDLAFFFQPQFQYHFTSNLNRFIDKVHSLNLEAGIKFRL